MASLRDIYTQSLVNKNKEIEKTNKKTKLWPFVVVEIFLGIALFYLLYETGFKRPAEIGNVILFYNFSFYEVFTTIVVLFTFFLIIIMFSGLNNIFKSIEKGFADRKVISQFICHNCLKSVLLEKLTFECPFCNEKYGEFAQAVAEQSENDLSGNFAKQIISSYDVQKKEKILFDKCEKCDSKIQYVQCYHCQKPINLFAPYNQEELEAKRYE